MSGNTWGQALRLTSWGESHGPAIGGVLDGLPPGCAIDLDQVQYYLDLRRPGWQPHTSPRRETDQLQVLSGLFEGKTLGTPLSFMVANSDQRSQDYDQYRDVFRPGHADYTYHKKYGIRDHRGGGRASARETVARVAAGAIAYQILKQLLGEGYQALVAVEQIGELSCGRTESLAQASCAGELSLTRSLSTSGSDQPYSNAPTAAQQQHEGAATSTEYAIFERQYFAASPEIIPEWQQYLEQVTQAGKSVGARLIFEIAGAPAGLGEPVFDKLDADLAAGLMSINAVKAVSIGQGEDAVKAKKGYDEMCAGDNVPEFQTNHAGGVLGGISSGQAITGSVTFKPTSSTMQSRQTIDQRGSEQVIDIAGRHDPCVGIRAVPIVWGMLNIIALDHLLRWRGQCGVDL